MPNPFEIAAVLDVEASADRLKRNIGIRERENEMADNTRAAEAQALMYEQLEISDRLSRENKVLREELDKSKALAKLEMLETRGLITTIQHLKRVWQQADPSQKGQSIKELVAKNIQDAVDDPKLAEEISEIVENKVRASPAGSKPRP
jgi:hypothetical protein